jgi:hypothetical protein
MIAHGRGTRLEIKSAGYIGRDHKNVSSYTSPSGMPGRSAGARPLAGGGCSHAKDAADRYPVNSPRGAAGLPQTGFRFAMGACFVCCCPVHVEHILTLWFNPCADPSRLGDARHVKRGQCTATQLESSRSATLSGTFPESSRPIVRHFFTFVSRDQERSSVRTLRREGARSAAACPNGAGGDSRISSVS